MPGPVSLTLMRQATASSVASTRTRPPAGVCSRQFLSTFSRASAHHASSPVKPAPACTRRSSRTSARSKGMASGAAAASTSREASTCVRRSRTAPASMRASLSRASTSHCTWERSCSLVRRRPRSWACASGPASLRASPSVRPSEVSGVLSWCDMSANESASEAFSPASSSAVMVRRVRALSTSLARIASSPSCMSERLGARLSCRASSTRSAMRASAR